MDRYHCQLKRSDYEIFRRVLAFNIGAPNRNEVLDAGNSNDTPQPASTEVSAISGNGLKGVQFGYDETLTSDTPPTTFRFAIHTPRIAVSCTPEPQGESSDSSVAALLEIERLDWRLQRYGSRRSEMETVCGEISLSLEDIVTVSSAPKSQSRPFAQLLCGNNNGRGTANGIECDSSVDNSVAPELVYLSASLPDGCSAESELVVSGGCIIADPNAWRETLAVFAYDAPTDAAAAGLGLGPSSAIVNPSEDDADAAAGVQQEQQQPAVSIRNESASASPCAQPSRSQPLQPTILNTTRKIVMHQPRIVLLEARLLPAASSISKFNVPSFVITPPPFTRILLRRACRHRMPTMLNAAHS